MMLKNMLRIIVFLLLPISAFAMDEDCLRYFPLSDGNWPSHALNLKGLSASKELYTVEGYMWEAIYNPNVIFGRSHPLTDRMFSTLSFQMNPSGVSDAPYTMLVTKNFLTSEYVRPDIVAKIYRNTKESWVRLMQLRLRGDLGDLHVAGLKSTNDSLMSLTSEYVPGVSLFEVFMEEPAPGYVRWKKPLGPVQMGLLSRLDHSLSEIYLTLVQEFAGRDDLEVIPMFDVIDGTEYLTSVLVEDDEGDFLFDLSPHHIMYDPLKDRLVIISPL